MADVRPGRDLSDDHHIWASNFTGVDTRQGGAAVSGDGDGGQSPAAGDSNQPAAGSQSDAPPAASGADAPKKINVTIVTSYGQTVRYWIQDRATDANNEAPEGADTVLINGDEHGPGDSIALNCVETAN